ncbi:DsbA family oxidoreductase [Stigmatella aurantiaca]|uniref:DSBA oxidoreductase family protein n=1 Tax=Stigmatella aurantiaca (strain DW4/3-1) TaxID=378806 RepID=Q095P7_STIAD|nr:DsbA family oxidoreductase [Stigmatella aurantiaca]ADO68353.1 DSBA oxidoreductase family protein [Stigmatella aurantiaca DW4/3-1]EAU67447.1 polyketide synthase [Stigmatella aurantiaca DW4/3-1]
MKTLTIDVHSDIVCPFCFISTRRLKNVLESLPEPIDVTVNHHAFFLRPTTPPEGLDLREYYRKKYGERIKELFAPLEAEARGSGIPLDLSKQTMAYQTTAAHTLIRHAHAKGTQLKLTDALFTAYFIDAKNVANPEVLAEIAAPYGFEAKETLRLVQDPTELAITHKEAEKALAMGVRGVPRFVFNNRFTLSGGQPPEAFRLAIQKATEGAR